MTTLALLPEPIKRLFDRVDVRPTHPDLEAAHEYWNSLRGDRVFPTAADLDLTDLGDAASQLFVLAQSDQTSRDWTLVFVGRQAGSVLVPGGDQQTLQGLRDRRLAVHIRRLIEFVREAGEPLAASFSVHSGTQYYHYHLFLAPLSADGHHVDGALGGVIGD